MVDTLLVSWCVFLLPRPPTSKRTWQHQGAVVLTQRVKFDRRQHLPNSPIEVKDAAPQLPGQIKSQIKTFLERGRITASVKSIAWAQWTFLFFFKQFNYVVCAPIVKTSRYFISQTHKAGRGNICLVTGNNWNIAKVHTLLCSIQKQIRGFAKLSLLQT